MGRLSSRLSVGFALAFAVSISSSSSSSLPFLSKYSSHINLSASPAPPPPPRCLASDLLSLLGTKWDAAAVEPRVARRLSSCLRFLVPFSPAAGCYSCSALPLKGPRRRRNLLNCCGGEEEDELVWWPPEPVMDVARIAVDSGGNPAAVDRALDPAMLPDLNAYLAFLFELIAARGPMVGLNVSLNRYDLFHGHIFLATGTGRLGIL
ncbi:hypothetical protein Taro_002922 [Colocasia esculenta]|uniref:Uncharacterized protein n=1 Tax=Colocasia esculenta TaxID=4460 RepID=A0A843TKK4_COLES|nr:hypothetical protein [Colocasia esculenta]